MTGKPRRSKADREQLIKELEDLDQRMRETDRQIGATLEKARQAQEMLQAIIARG